MQCSFMFALLSYTHFLVLCTWEAVIIKYRYPHTHNMHAQYENKCFPCMWWYSSHGSLAFFLWTGFSFIIIVIKKYTVKIVFTYRWRWQRTLLPPRMMITSHFIVQTVLLLLFYWLVVLSLLFLVWMMMVMMNLPSSSTLGLFAAYFLLGPTNILIPDVSLSVSFNVFW